MFDAAIIGSGPAGLSAALNLKLLGKEVIWFGSPASEKVEKSEKIANYPGMGLISGAELTQRFIEHAREFAISPVNQLVTSIMTSKSRFLLLAENEVYEARTVLLAIGAVSAKGLPGEVEYLGKGVSYCATCDGFLYRGKRIAVLCGSPHFEHEVQYLADLAGETFLYPQYQGCELKMDRMRTLLSPVVRVLGEEKVSGILLRDGTKIPVDGVFCLRNAVAPAVLLSGLAMDGAHIVVDRQCRTNLPGCFAAGDCTGRPYQIAKAVGEGNVAAHSIAAYLAEEEV